MARIAVVGDGPAGLSAALFLAKAGHEVAVHGDDKTAVHFALLRNYLGVPDTLGDAFQETARAQIAGFGAAFTHHRVTSVTSVEGRFELTLDDGSSMESDYLVLAEGRSPDIVDGQQRTSLPGVYAPAGQPGHIEARRSSPQAQVRSPPSISSPPRPARTSPTGIRSRRAPSLGRQALGGAASTPGRSSGPNLDLRSRQRFDPRFGLHLRGNRRRIPPRRIRQPARS